MKRILSLMAALLLLAFASPSRAAERELCQMEFPVMLMTDGECRAYLKQRNAFIKRRDMAGLQLLDAYMRDELIERAAACPCAADQPGKLALSQTDC